MRVVNFEKISIKNFLSVGEEPVKVDFRPGLHIITGINKDKQDRRNGVGKSTVADAIHFAIFGTTIRELTKDNIVNNLIGRGTEVVLNFSIEKDTYKIVRTLKPSKCFLYVNGEDATRDSMTNTTEYICKVLDTTQEIFQNCVIMTVNNTVPFMAKKKIEKRKFVEGIFGLEVFSQMLSQARSNYNDVKRDYDSSVTRCEEVEKNLDSWKVKQQELTDKRNHRVDKLVNRKNSNNEKIQDIKDNTSKCNDKQLNKLKEESASEEAKIEKCQNHLTVLGQDKVKQESAISVLKSTLSKIGTDKEKCPVCLKPMSDHDRDDLKSEKQKLKDQIQAIITSVDGLTSDISTYNNLKVTLKNKLTQTNNAYNECILKRREAESNQDKINQFHKWNEEVDIELSELKEEKDTFGDTINEYQQRLNKLNEEIASIKHNLEILDVIKFIVSEEGVKSYIVRKILQLFNGKLQHYLRRMDANCCCIFNEYFEDEIINEKNKTCSYHNFSGAEKKNIDLACLFAFMDIRRLQGNVAFNFSIYDELLDSSLDERGVDLVLSILQERVEKYNECIIIISHRKESVKIGSHYKNPGEVIFLEKDKGITRRVDYIE